MVHRTILTTTTLAIALVITPLANAADDNPWDLDKRFGEWKTLFNGTDLSGWQTAKTRQQGGQNRWRVEDGAMTNISGGMNDICTVEEFTDYELEIEYKLPERDPKKPNSPNGNSGVYLRGTCEVQIFDSYGKKGKLTAADAGAIYGVGYIALANPQKKPGEWNKYRIVHVGDRITVYHNTVLIQDNVFQNQKTGSAMNHYPVGDKHKLDGKKGPLMLQGDHSKVWYRNVRIRPLATGEGWRSLWNGKDLSEFTAHDDRRAKKGLRWEVKDHAFTNTAMGGGGHDLWTKEAFGNFLAFYQYRSDLLKSYKGRADRSGNSGFYLRDQWEIQIHGTGPVGKSQSKHGDGALYSYHPPARISHNGNERWNTMCVRLVDNKITVWQNGVLIHDNVVLATRTDNHRTKTPGYNEGPFKLQGDHAKVWFTNMRILPLPKDAKE